MIPFQLSPVETWKSVRKAMPKFSKVACRLMPSQGFSSLQTGRIVGSTWPAAESPAGPAPRCCLLASSQTTSEVLAGCAQPTDGETEAQGGGTQVETQAQVSRAPGINF